MSVAEKLTAIADKIRLYTANTEKLTLDDMANGVEDVHGIGLAEGEAYGREIGEVTGIEQGKQDAYDEFWDDFQENGNRKYYIACFGTGWSTNTFKPKYPIKPENAGYMFFNNMGQHLAIPDFVEFADNLAAEQGKTPETHPDMFDEEGHYKLLDFSECTYALYALPALKSPHFGTLDFSKCRTVDSLFYGHGLSTYGVQRIDKFISADITVFGNAFSQATYLTDITMSGVVAKSINFGNCPLNKASIESVVSVLSDTVTGQTATFKKTAKEAAFTEQEWNTLIAAKPNWTITLV